MAEPKKTANKKQKSKQIYGGTKKTKNSRTEVTKRKKNEKL